MLGGRDLILGHVGVASYGSRPIRRDRQKTLAIYIVDATSIMPYTNVRIRANLCLRFVDIRVKSLKDHQTAFAVCVRKPVSVSGSSSMTKFNGWNAFRTFQWVECLMLSRQYYLSRRLYGKK